MRIHIVATDSGHPHQSMTTYVVDDTIALDAGCLVQLSLAQQQRIQHILLTHVHLDHVAALPMFIDNVYRHGSECPTVYASDYSIHSLKQHVFNNCLWPDFLALATSESPFVRMVPLSDETPIDVDGLRVTPIPVTHPIPTYGFILEREGRRAALVTDTGPTERIWQVLSSDPPHLVLIDVSFPNRMSDLAVRSGHLSPQLLRRELEKLRRVVPTLAIHIKPAFYDEVTWEIEELNLPYVIPARVGETYEV